jgi:hypothetical protein
MFTDLRCLDHGSIIRAAAARRPVLTTHGPAVLVRWATPHARNRARIMFGEDRFRTVACTDVIAVDVGEDGVR